MEWRLNELIRFAKQNQGCINYIWMPTRPKLASGWLGFKIRVVGAYKVLTGKADAVVWPGDQ